MSRMTLLLPSLLGLMVLFACRHPDASSAWEQAQRDPLAAAIEVRRPANRKDFETGFRSGAGMVRQALLNRARPYLLKPSSGVVRTPTVGHLPPGATVLAPPPEPEVDVATGLKLEYMDEDTPFGVGQVDGFTWALQARREDLALAGLIRPTPVPALPNKWTPWPAGSSEVVVEGANHLTATIHWLGDTLFWRHSSLGFPGHNRWRAFHWPGHPSRVALADGALWLEVAGQGSMALDLDTGWIRAVQF